MQQQYKIYQWRKIISKKYLKKPHYNNDHHYSRGNDKFNNLSI